MKNRKIRISVADKGGAVIVQDTSAYVAEIEKQLTNERHYLRIKNEPTSQIAKLSNTLVHDLFDAKHITEETCKGQLSNPTPCSVTSALPKVHKTLTNPPGRPIVSGVNDPTEKLSKLVDSWLQLYVRTVPSYVKDMTHMLRTIEQWNHDHGRFDDNIKLITLDVVGLYTNIPQDEIETALRFHLHDGEFDDIPPTDKIIDIVDHVLRNNIFKFEEQLFKQIHGIAMGTPMAPSIAILLMAFLERGLRTGRPVLLSHAILT